MLGKKEPSMFIVGCDFHPSWQQIAVCDSETGEVNEHKLRNSDGEAEQFYRKLPAPARVGLEACGNSQWFVKLLEELGHEVWIGDAAQIRASYVRKQKTDKRDALHILKLLLENRFPRLWTPSAEIRNQRQLLVHRHKLVRLRAQVKNELQHLAMNQGVQRKARLWSQAGQKLLRALPLAGWAASRRANLLELMKLMDRQIAELDQALEQAAEENPQARLLRTQPGVGPVTALAFVLTLGDVSRFPRGKQVASYLLIIWLLEQAPIGSVEACPDRHSPKRSASFSPTLPRRKPASDIWQLVGGRMGSRVRDAGIRKPMSW